MSNGVITTDAYFLGTMLFIGNFVDANKNVIKVVDGQQRLTTITILFSVISDLFKKCGEEELAERIFRYIMDKDDDNKEVRILLTKSNHPYFAYFIQDYKKEHRQSPESEEEENIRQTYDYFYKSLQEKKLRSMLKQNLGSSEVDNLNFVDILKAIREQVLDCSFISISTSTQDQANRIFEILNAKGKRLDEVDLIKNLIFEVLNKEEPADFANETWTKIRKIVEDIDSGVGISTFYRHFWAAVYKKTSSGRLYDDFKNKVRKSRPEYKKFLLEMAEYATLYVQIINPNISNYGNKQQYRWLVQSLESLTNTFGIVQVRVPLMALLNAKKREVINMAAFKKCIVFLENFHFEFNVVVSDRGNKLDTIYSKFAVDLHNSDSKSKSNVLVDGLIHKMNPLFPSFTKFRDEFVKMVYYKESQPTNIKTKYALYKLNTYYSGEEVFATNLSIEHIVPESEGTRTIGNLILLETNLNNQAGENDYENKKKIYQKSSIKWVSDFVQTHPIWGKNDFPLRANKMAEEYYVHIFGRSIKDDK